MNLKLDLAKTIELVIALISWLAIMWVTVKQTRRDTNGLGAKVRALEIAVVKLTTILEERKTKGGLDEGK